MAKGKGSNAVQNRAIYSRISFLQQAAVTLSTLGHASKDSKDTDVDANAAGGPSTPGHPNRDATAGKALEAMSRRLTTDLRAVSLKTRVRLQPALKQTICKFCDSALIEGKSCTSRVENKSRGAKKPWADILVRRCHTCGREKNYPVCAARQKRKTDRKLAGTQSPEKEKPKD